MGVVRLPASALASASATVVPAMRYISFAHQSRRVEVGVVRMSSAAATAVPPMR
jgi:hypothetical protein